MFNKRSNDLKIEAEILIPFFIVIVCLLLFIFIANLVQLGKTKSFDDWILLSLRDSKNINQPVGPEWLEIAMINITALGSTAVITLITIIVAGYLVFQKNYIYVFVILLATIGGALMILLLKNFFGRERPEVVPHLIYAFSFSFPSGHSMMSAVVYLTQASLVSKIQESKSLKIYILTVAIILTVLIGISRIYLGVHYPTDVLAGWALGTAWAYICWLLVNHFTEGRLLVK
jgi:undecaprenyl-diphosphatase